MKWTYQKEWSIYELVELKKLLPIMASDIVRKVSFTGSSTGLG
ncbi:hypothetical protein [Peribacillus frigoritolerans]